MKPFEIPTDNLYKFLAISGLCLIIVGSTFPFRYAYETYKQVHQLSGEIGVMELEMKYLEEQTGSLEGKQDSLNPSTPAEHSPEINKENISLKGLSKELQIKILQLKNKNDLFLLQSKLARMFVFMGGLSTGTGFCLAFVGFYFWYHRLQKYQDKIVEYESKNIEDRRGKS